MPCSNWTSGELGPLNIDYDYFYACQCSELHTLAGVVMILWSIYLIGALGSTADRYFSKSLTKMSENLHIRYDIAGVTFLAFGNGAPDVFSSISSFTGGDDNLASVGIGAILGASVFVSCVVVGSIAMICPCDVSPTFFIRDISFHILAITVVLAIGLHESISLWSAASLLGLYISYVAVVLIGSYRNPVDQATVDSTLPIPLSSGIQTAFWHRSKSKHKGRIYNSLQVGESTENLSKEYQFLTLDNANDGDEVTINLSGGIHQEFDGEIVEDYFNSSLNTPKDDKNELYLDESLAMKGKKFEPFEIMTPEQSLTQDLLPSQSNKKLKSMHLNSLTALYWRQKTLRLKIHRTLFDSEWWTLSVHEKVWSTIELPLTLARDLTVPTCEADRWNKYTAMSQPIFASLFLNYIIGYSDSSALGVPAPLLWTLFSLPGSLIVFLFTHYNKPPGALVGNIWNFLGFLISIAWIYTLAKELVICLASMGQSFHVAPAFLGLTILAWGNSVGDFFSNTAIAKQGYGDMALAGCYGGPVFNILFGLGITFSYVCWQTFPAALDIKLELSEKLSLGFLYTSLLSTLVVVTIGKFKIQRGLGIYLLALYVVFTVCQLLLVSFNKR